MRLVIVLLLTLAITGACAAYGFVTATLSADGPLQSRKLVFIAPGSSAHKIAATLTAAGAIDSPLFFRLAVRLKEKDGPLKAGEYRLPAYASINDLVFLLQEGKAHARQITLSEGLTSREIVDILNGTEVLTGKIDTIPPEGTLLPETYHYIYGEARSKVLGRLQKAMTQTLAKLWEERAENLPLKTPAEALTLASIVEKETGVAAERARVAGVFINRLRKGMPLQSDPTVIYALTEGKKKLERKLYRKDLNIASPYNTYYTKELPPGPIANPGQAALQAVLHPETHQFYYFVADGSGGHAFGRTLEDHTRNVGRWRRFQKQQP